MQSHYISFQLIQQPQISDISFLITSGSYVDHHSKSFSLLDTAITRYHPFTYFQQTSFYFVVPLSQFNYVNKQHHFFECSKTISLKIYQLSALLYVRLLFKRNELCVSTYICTKGSTVTVMKSNIRKNSLTSNKINTAFCFIIFLLYFRFVLLNNFCITR